MGNAESSGAPRPPYPYRHPPQAIRRGNLPPTTVRYTQPPASRPVPMRRPPPPQTRPPPSIPRAQQQQQQQQSARGEMVKISDFRHLSIANVNDKIQEFETVEQQKQRLFDEEQERRKHEYEAQKTNRRKTFEKEIKSFEESHHDPYKILDLDKNDRKMDAAIIKKAYYKKAQKHHPDKGGDPEKFKVITQSYCYLINKYDQTRESNLKMERPVVKQDYNPAVEEHKYENIYVSKDNFSINRFNEVFEKYRVDDDPYQDGYGQLAGDDVGNSGERERLTERLANKGSMFADEKFNREIFNKTFADENYNDEMTVYQEPEALPSAAGVLDYRELGRDKISDFGGNNFTDYRRAYTESKFNPDKVQYRQYRNLDELKSERSNLSTAVSAEDKERIRLKELAESERESRRLQKVKEEDEKYQEHFGKINRLFIKS